METVAETSEFVLIYKSAGTAVESRNVMVPDLCHLLKQRYGELSVINRLDQPVEGLVLFAKNKKSAADLSEQMRFGKIKKEYLCAVRGRPDPQDGVLCDWLLKDARTNTSRAVPEGTKGAKKALLEYQVLDTADIGGECFSLVKILLKTGRHHQIRVQLAAFGHPIAGDRKYGKDAPGIIRKCGADGTQAIDVKYPALCAYRLTFTDPRKKQTVSFSVQPEGGIFRAFEYDFTDI